MTTAPAVRTVSAWAFALLAVAGAEGGTVGLGTGLTADAVGCACPQATSASRTTVAPAIILVLAIAD